VSARYWFFKELALDVPVFDVLGCKSVNALTSKVLERVEPGQSSASDAVEVPEPKRHTDLSVRPLSNSQPRLWFLYRFIPGKTIYNLLLVCHIEGALDWPRFHDAFQSSLLVTESFVPGLWTRKIVSSKYQLLRHTSR
jgi:hypothetical protein